MASVADARHVIEDIASDYRACTEEMLARSGDDSEKLISLDVGKRKLRLLAEKAVEQLAIHLYSKEIHFILEMIQNANDCDFAADTEPFLQISVYPEKISFACNEQGFTSDQVRALCNIATSTKTRPRTSSRSICYVGAKGIGFKSVFKVAERVYIRSPPFSFMFDKSEELGMIIPKWVENTPLPETPDSPQTQILLLPPADRRDYTRLFEDFKTIHSTILLFLKNLRKIEVGIYEHAGKDGALSRKLFSSHFSPDENLVTLATSINNSLTEKNFHLSRSFRNDMPAEDSRDGILRSEVIVGFPVDSRGEPHEAAQSVHAFLPIREFGFKFLIQADFILTSNRQDLDEGCPWNIALRDTIPSVFQQAIFQFAQHNQHESLRYTWMRYLPTNIFTAFWEPVQTGILALLRSTATIETQHHHLKTPSSLYSQNPTFLDRNSQLLVGDDEDFISSNYHKQDFPALKWLGVKSATWRWFMDTVKTIPDDDISSRSLEWHEDLAKIFCEMPPDLWTTYEATLVAKVLIPLRNGTWTAIAKQRAGIYLQDGEADNETQVPKDITLNLVSKEVSSSKHRKRFFKKLGVRDYSAQVVTKFILAYHNDSRNSPPSLAQAIGHVKHLYNVKSSANTDFKGLWLYDHLGIPSKGCNIYLRDSSIKYSAAKLFEEPSTVPMKFLHPEYTKSMSKKDIHEFSEWLMERTSITTIPRLLTTNGNLTPEFLAIMSKSSAIFLNTLKQSWNEYKNQVKGGIKKKLTNQLVDCISSDGSKESCILGDCFAPNGPLLEIVTKICAGTDVPFLNLPRPLVKKEWKFLASLGVGFEESQKFYFWILKRQKFREECTLEMSRALYSHIHTFSAAQAPRKRLKLQQEFINTNSIFVPGKKIWSKPDQCVWDSPVGFSSMFSLKSAYNSNRRVEILFEDLEIRDASIDQVLSDLQERLGKDQLVTEEVVETCKYLLKKLPTQEPGSSNEERRQSVNAIRNVFASNPLIPISSEAKVKTVTIASCLWSAPDCMNSKFMLKKVYETDPEMMRFIQGVLRVPSATTDDLLEELLFLKKTRPKTSLEARSIYEYWALIPPKGDAQIKEVRRQFEEQALILVSYDDGSFRWKRISECTWSATNPELLNKIPIGTIFGQNPQLSGFFQETLGIKNADLSDYLTELQDQKKSNIFDLRRTKEIYSKIQQLMGPMRTSRKMEIFESVPLILVPVRNDPQWVYPKDCVWARTNSLLKKVSLMDEYGNFKRLFCGRLGIRDATPTMLVAELVGLGQENGPINPETLQHVKNILIDLNSFVKGFRQDGKFEEPITELLLQERCWLCSSHINREKQFLTSQDLFFIGDTASLSKMFSNKVSTLALSHADISNIMDLLVHLRMEGKLMSRSIIENIELSGNTERSDHLTTELRSRADVLFRYVSYYDSNRSKKEIEHLRLMLSGITVHTVPVLLTRHMLKGQGSYFSNIELGVMLLREEESKLVIYVSNNENDQVFTWLSILPQKLKDYFNIHVENAGLILNNILNLNPSYIDKLLDDLGIPRSPVESPASSHEIPSAYEQLESRDTKLSDPEIRSNTSQATLVDDKDNLMFVPMTKAYLYSGYTDKTVEKAQDQIPDMSAEICDNLYGPPKATLFAPEREPPRKRKAEIVQLSEDQASKRISGLPRGFATVVKRKQSEDIGFSVPSQRSVSDQSTKSDPEIDKV